MNDINNTRTVYGIWSEWDLGLYGILFSTKEKAKEFAQKAYEKSICSEEEPFGDVWGDLLGLEDFYLNE